MPNVQDLKKQISSLQGQIEEIQKECSHPKACLTKVARSDTGNYDRSQDCYWYDCHCSLCDKHWTEEQ